MSDPSVSPPEPGDDPAPVPADDADAAASVIDGEPAPAAVASADVAPADVAPAAVAPSADALGLRFAPVLGVLAALAAVVDLALNRIAVRVMNGHLEPTEILAWMRFGALPRNIVGVTGLLALFGALIRYLRMPGFAPLYIRLPVASFSGILLPTLALAAVLPRERMAPHLVLFAMFAATVVVCLFSLSALGYRGSRPLRIGLALVLATAIQALIVVTIASVRAMVVGGFGGPIAYLARNGGELTWLLVPIVIAGACLPSAWNRRETWNRRELVAGVLGGSVTLFVLALGIVGELSLHPHYSTIVYGAFRVTSLPEAGSLAYVVPPAIALGAGVLGIASPDPWRRQVGAGLLLWTAGGYAGRSPVQLLDTVLAVVCFARAAQSADPEGLRRAALGWSAAGWSAAGRSAGGRSAAGRS